MSREIRRVPANWEHPEYTQDTAYRREQIGEYISLHDNYDKALKEFASDIKKKGLSEALEDHGGGPLRDEYASYEGKPLKWYQLYQTVSEGTPESPPFATKKELIDYLVKNGSFCGNRYSLKSATAMVEEGWAPSAIFDNGKMYVGADALVRD